jgi:ribosomal protein S18 acetylase RimI-like enzyme
MMGSRQAAADRRRMEGRMMDARTILRRARASDAKRASALIYESGGPRLLVADERVARRIARWSFLAPGSAFGYRRSIVADRGGNVEGLIALVPGARWRSFRVWTGLAMVLAAGARNARALVANGRRVESEMAPIRRDVLYVIALATSRSARGRGIGSRLLLRAVQEARRLSLRAVVLDTESDNEGAIAFYGRAGFRCIVRRGGTVRLERTV